jgi:hypothetical protein
MRNLSAILMFLILAVCAFSLQVRAHGDPEIQEQRILTVAVGKDPELGAVALSSEGFQLVVPPFTVELLWRVNSARKETIAFSVLNGSAVMLAGVRDGSKSRIPKADRLTIGNVSGSDDPFMVEIYAHTVHWDH